MNKLAYFYHLALNNLRRGGQRVLVALLCIVFGVMSLVAMTVLAGSIERTLVLDPRQVLGGDLSLSRAQEEFLQPDHISQLQSFQDSGLIQRFTTIAYTSSLMYHRPASGEVRFAGAGMGIDPHTYPIAGSLIIGEPGNVGLATLLQEPGDVVITRDIAREQGFHVGEALIIADQSSGVPVSGHIRGIVYDTPNHQGGKIYYNLQTAQSLAGNHPPVNTVMVNTGQPETLMAALEKTGWGAVSAPQLAAGHEQSEDLILVCVKGAGILGLLVGGIGIANTMQVLLRRRQREIAIWKAIGYRESQLVAMFALEALVLGLIGSLIGAGLGVLVSSELTVLFGRTSNLLFDWTVSPAPVLIGFMVGVLTTLIFALWAIIGASQARPMALLRNEAENVKQIPRLKAAGLLVVIAIPFIGLTALVMGSLVKGVGVLLFALAGLIVLGGFFAGTIWAAARFLPLRLPLARLAQQSLRHRGLTPVFAMIALFAGVVTMTLGVVVTQGSQREMSARNIELNGYNLDIIASPSQETTVRHAVEKQSPDQIGLGYTAPVQAIHPAGSGESSGMQDVLIGRSDPFDYQLSGAAWGSQPQGVYVFSNSVKIPVGSQVEVAFWDGSRHTYPVVGTYNLVWSPGNLYPQPGLLLPADLLIQTAKPDSVTFFVKMPPTRLARAASDLGKALPDATVINLLAYATRFIQTYKNLFVLAVAMSALALLAGVLLVANAVSLAMLDRRYEIGILKTLGYSRRHILAALGVEYSLIALIASAVGLLSVRGFLFVVGRSNPLAASILLMPLPLSLGILLGAAGLIFATILAVTWGPVRVSPVLVLNDRG